MKSKNIAIYLDFENLAISAHEVYRGIKKPMQVDSILKFAEKKGRIRIKKAYADWSKKKFSQYQGVLIADGFELIHLPETNKQGKNGSDMRLVIDVMDQLNMHPNIDTVVIGSGDSDFIPLIQYMVNKENDVIVIGFEHSVSGVMKNYCTEFKSIESILGKPATANRSRISRSDPGRRLLVSFLSKRKENTPVLMKELKKLLLKANPDFNEKEQGHISFKKFMKHWVGDLVEKIEKEKDGLMVYFLPFNDSRYGTSSRSTQTRSTQARSTQTRRSAPKNRSTLSSRTKTPASPQKTSKATSATPAKTSSKDSKREKPGYKKARELMIQFIREHQSDKPWALTRIKQQLLKIDPKFSEKEAGFRYFKHFIVDLEGDLIEKLEMKGKTTYAHFKKMPPLEETAKAGEDSPIKKKQAEPVKKVPPSSNGTRQQEEKPQRTSQQKELSAEKRPERQPERQPERRAQRTDKRSTERRTERQPERQTKGQSKGRSIGRSSHHTSRKEEIKQDIQKENPKEVKRAFQSPSRSKNTDNPVKTVNQPAKTAVKSDKDYARSLLAKELFYNNNHKERLQIAKSLMEGFGTFPIMTLEQMVTYIRERSKVKASDILFRKYVFTLKHGGVLVPSQGDVLLSGKLLKLKPGIKNADDLDGMYIEQISNTLKDRFPKLGTGEILEVLF